MICCVEFDSLNKLTYEVLDNLLSLIYQNHQNYILEPCLVEFQNIPQFSGKYRIIFEFSVIDPWLGYSLLLNQGASLCLTTSSPKPYLLDLNNHQIFIARWIENKNLLFAAGKFFSSLFALWFGKKELINCSNNIPSLSWVKTNTPIREVFTLNI